MAREEMISPELQKNSIEEWARRKRRRIVKWVVDLDATGRNFKRKIMEAIGYVEDGTAKEIAVWKYSRFGRVRHGNAVNLERVERAGGQLESATEDIDARNAVGRFQRGMLLELAAFESDRAGEQWIETHQWRRDHGLPAMGRPRFGYTWHQRKRYEPDGTVTVHEERYEPDPKTSKVVEDLYLRYIAGESFRSLALWLNDEGHRTVRGDLWSGKAVKRYMDSGFPAGYLRLHLKTCPQGSFPHDCEQYELVRHPTLHHPAIISDDTWRQYQERRDFTRTAAPRARHAAYPLTSLVRCGLCNGAARRNVDHRGQARYVCLKRAERGQHSCPGTGLKSEVIEGAVRAKLAHFVDEINGAAGSAEVAVPGQRGRDSKDRRRAQLEESLAKLERSIVRHMRAYAMAEDDDPNGNLEKEYLATLRDLRAEKSALTEELAKLRADLEGGGQETTKAAAITVVEGLLEEWETLPPNRLNALLRKVVEKVILQPGNGTMEIYPTWTSEPWTWTDPQADKPKSKHAAVLAMREANPGVRPQQIVDQLAAQGVTVTAGYIRACVSRAARASRKRGDGGL